jgi:RNA polymerase-interacting CarD/CdnL/TRCF family regulator
LKDVLDCLLLYADVRANIIERPTTSHCLNVFSALVKKLSAEYKKGATAIFERQLFRELMKQLNLFGGIKLLNTMKEKDINRFINKTLSTQPHM